MRSISNNLTILTAAIFGLILSYTFFFRALPAVSELPDYGKIESFQLIDSRDQLFDTASLTGKVWVVSFFFTSCPEVCPDLNRRLAMIADKFPKEDRLRFVSISVDPMRDTPQRLDEYSKHFPSLQAKWHLLTGEKEKISSISDQLFKLGKIDDPNMHSTRIILIDSKQSVRGYFRGREDQGNQELVKAISQMLNLEH
jgi:protein SCO1/2